MRDFESKKSTAGLPEALSFRGLDYQPKVLGGFCGKIGCKIWCKIMNIPFKYHKRTRRLFMQLNGRLNEKMKLIKLKSFKNPLKISLMNTNLDFN